MSLELGFCDELFIREEYHEIQCHAAKFGRPVLVSFSSPDVVHAFLKRRKFLKKTPRFKKVYISQDFTAEERAERRQLVEKLKEKIKQSPDERHYIFNGQVYSDQNAKKVDNLDTTTFNFLFDTTES